MPRSKREYYTHEVSYGMLHEKFGGQLGFPATFLEAIGFLMEAGGLEHNGYQLARAARKSAKLETCDPREFLGKQSYQNKVPMDTLHAIITVFEAIFKFTAEDIDAINQEMQRPHAHKTREFFVADRVIEIINPGRNAARR